MKRRTKHSKRVRRDKLVRFLVTKQERDAMRVAAETDGVPLSLWIRVRCFSTSSKFEVAPPARQGWLDAQRGKS